MENRATHTQKLLRLNPFTVSAVFCDGSGNFIQHCFAADAQSARDQMLMQTGGAVIIASVFDRHLTEPDEKVNFLNETEELLKTEAAGGRSD